MVVYIRETGYSTENTTTPYYINVGAYLRGEKVVRYRSIHEIEKLTSEDLVIDYVHETRALLALMGIGIKEIDYPEELQPLFGRKIREGVIGEIVNNPDNWGQFVKPKEGSKLFTGRVVNGTKDLIGISMAFDYPVWISEAVDFKREWRCFIKDKQVIDVRPYRGDYHYQYNPKIIEKAIELWDNSPRAYALDIGVTADNRTLLVEINDGYAVGNYGLSPIDTFLFYEARWQELVAPYFKTHKELVIPKDRYKEI